MGCGTCGTATADGKPSGCQSNGGCSTGGCNRLNVFNWLSDLPLSDPGKPYPIIEVSFNKGSRKDFFKNNAPHIFDKGQWVTVEGANGFDVGQISLTGELVKLQMKKYSVTESSDLKRILRPSVERDLELYNLAKEKEKETLIRSRAIAKQLNLEMKIAEAEFQADGKKVTFFYTADSRVDFRELIKIYATEFRAKVEMRQIGARQESGKVGGIGSCGRELCCSTWLTDFKTVNTTAARYQNLSINQAKLSGQCGRLKCCLNYELDTYMDALHGFPDHAEHLELVSGRAYLQKKDIFRNLMWYSFAGSNKQYPLTIERVQEIKTLNASGEKPDEIGAIEIQVRTNDPDKAVDMGFVNDVGQITLTSLSKSSRKKQGNKSRSQQAGAKPKNQQQGQPAKEQGRNQGSRPKATQQQARTSGPGNNRPEAAAKAQDKEKTNQPAKEGRKEQQPNQRRKYNRPPRKDGDAPPQQPRP